VRGRWCKYFSECANEIDGPKDGFYEELEHVVDQFPRYHMEIVFIEFSVKFGRGYPPSYNWK
jgi:hypothetical protein